MDGNKDESERCIRLAQKYLAAGENERALKFLNKAERLYPSQKAKDLIEKLSNINGSSAGQKTDNADDSQNQTHARRRKNSKDRTEPEEKDFTPEQLEGVRRIKKCKDYYEILCVSKDATENDLKKAYRKLALQMHPDKNKAPGATEAFKAIGNAFAVLSDEGKRRKYDMYGPEQEQTSHREHDYSHGFEGDISPEELFNMFFGGGFPSSQVYTSHHSHGRSRHHQHHTYHYRRQDTYSNDGSYTLFLQLAPILLLVVLSLLSSFFVGDPLYSLQRTEKYSSERKTSHLRVLYYVKSDFRIEFKSDLRRIERQVEEDYITSLRQNCWRERNNKENMMWRARNFADAKLYERAQNMETPSCDKLGQIYS